MLAVTKHIYVLNNYHVIFCAVVHIHSKCFVKHTCNVIVCIVHPFKHFFIHTRNTIRSFYKSFPVRIISECNYYSAYMFFYCFCINCQLVLHSFFIGIPYYFVQLKLQIYIIKIIFFHKINYAFR